MGKEDVQCIKKIKKVVSVVAWTPIAKPLNGTLPRSKNSTMLRLAPVEYTYKHGKEVKSGRVETYLIKGLRGALRHSAMSLLREAGLEVCHSSDKEATQEGKALIPEGFHPLGACEKDPCILNRIFGWMRHQSRIAVYADPIGCPKHKTFAADVPLQPVQIATENRVALTFDHEAIQDFGERYFSGEFRFHIDVSALEPEELGLVIQSAMTLHRLGRGFNAGYGHIKIQQLTLEQVTTERRLQWDGNGSFRVEETESREPLHQEVLDALQAFQLYLNAQTGES
ncbi:MAG: RAMP superfamily CRISPR-associated protein [Candidatus Heimdallarchaeota archaeon]